MCYTPEMTQSLRDIAASLAILLRRFRRISETLCDDGNTCDNQTDNNNGGRTVGAGPHEYGGVSGVWGRVRTRQ